ncbi:cell division protein FtsW [Acetobacter orientalis]|uniref:Cell division protein FtsW n=1 Tax=Acetobacter orientalis TaxID=146474 RepID=A0A2Z5ZH95_9PROT|nr:cell division protein FtsW [Acetobacter orientalis]
MGEGYDGPCEREGKWRKCCSFYMFHAKFKYIETINQKTIFIYSVQYRLKI